VSAPRIAVLMATYNRVEVTNRCLNSLTGFFGPTISIHVFLVDAGSTDGTSQIKGKADLPITVINGESSWLWSTAMSIGQEIILDKWIGNYDYILWLNDDVFLDSNLSINWELIFKTFPETILVGQLSEADSKMMSYGGLKRIDWHPLHFEMIFHGSMFGTLDTFTGNFVLIPMSVARQPELRTILSLYQHLYADIDYGISAGKIGIPILAIPGFVGICINDHPEFVEKGILNRFKAFKNPKSVHFKSQLIFLKRHAKRTWLLLIFLPILRAIFGLAAKSTEIKISS